MGKVGTFVGAALPPLFTMAGLVIALLIVLGPAPFYFVNLNVSRVSVTVNGDEYKGIIDPNNYSKNKDFFRIYLWRYCSGMITDGVYKTDFCSSYGKLLYDLLPYWSIWGIAMKTEGLNFGWLREGPKFLSLGYSITLFFIGFSQLFGSLERCNRILARISIVISGCAVCAALGTAIAGQVTYLSLIRRTRQDDIAITGTLNYVPFVCNWIMVWVLSVAMGLRIRGIYGRERKRRSHSYGKVVATPVPRDETKDTTQLLHGESVTKPVPLRALKEEEETAYEPFRQRRPEEGP